MSDGTKKVIMSVVAVVLISAAIYTASGFFGEDEYIEKANQRALMDSETGELFPFELTEDWDLHYPHKNPKTGTETLFPIEWCFNRECGAKGGTPVILNEWLEKKPPTYCPKCGSLVRFHNPKPPKPKELPGVPPQ